VEWRSLIQDRKTHALRLLKQLIVGRLELIPNMEERYYGFWGTGTPLPVIADPYHDHPLDSAAVSATNGSRPAAY
jgi:hypothetical protein